MDHAVFLELLFCFHRCVHLGLVTAAHPLLRQPSVRSPASARAVTLGKWDVGSARPRAPKERPFPALLDRVQDRPQAALLINCFPGLTCLLHVK